MKFKGKVMKTVVRGTVVYDRGKLIGSAGYGKFIRRQNIRQLDRTLTL